MRCPVCGDRDTENYECEWENDYTARRHWNCNGCDSSWWETGWVADPSWYNPKWNRDTVEIEPSEQGEKILAQKWEQELMKIAQGMTIPMFA